MEQREAGEIIRFGNLQIVRVDKCQDLRQLKELHIDFLFFWVFVFFLILILFEQNHGWGNQTANEEYAEMRIWMDWKAMKIANLDLEPIQVNN